MSEYYSWLSIDKGPLGIYICSKEDFEADCVIPLDNFFEESLTHLTTVQAQQYADSLEKFVIELRKHIQD